MSEIELLKQTIEMAKKRPNSLARNKLVSHAEDALAHAYRLPQDAPMPNEPPPGVNYRDCTCVTIPGMINNTCKLHGHQA